MKFKIVEKKPLNENESSKFYPKVKKFLFWINVGRDEEFCEFYEKVNNRYMSPAIWWTASKENAEKIIETYKAFIQSQKYKTIDHPYGD